MFEQKLNQKKKRINKVQKEGKEKAMAIRCCSRLKLLNASFAVQIMNGLEQNTTRFFLLLDAYNDY